MTLLEDQSVIRKATRESKATQRAPEDRQDIRWAYSNALGACGDQPLAAVPADPLKPGWGQGARPPLIDSMLPVSRGRR